MHLVSPEPTTFKIWLNVRGMIPFYDSFLGSPNIVYVFPHPKIKLVLDDMLIEIGNAQT